MKMITVKAQTMYEAARDGDYETLAQLFVERMARKAVEAHLAEAVETIKEFTPAHYRLLMNILESGSKATHKNPRGGGQ